MVKLEQVQLYFCGLDSEVIFFFYLILMFVLCFLIPYHKNIEMSGVAVKILFLYDFTALLEMSKYIHTNNYDLSI